MKLPNKQWRIVALLCLVAAVLAALILWRQPGAPAAPEEHAGHADSHGHDDRHEEKAPAAHAGDDIAMTAAQVRANGIGLEPAGPARIQELLHLPAQVNVDAERTVAVAAPGAGMVQSIAVTPGSTVAQGQALLVLHSPEVATWRADLATARQRRQQADAVYQRERQLWEERISARQDMEAAQAALAEARIAEQAAQGRLRALGIGTTGGAGLTGAVTVRAPIAGVVIERPVTAGSTVDAGKPLLTVADLSRVWIEAALPTENLPQVRVGMPATISAAALEKPLAGTVSFVGPVLGETTRMATVRVTLANPGLRLRPGMLATLDLMGQHADAAVSVASDAVQTIHERSVVFVRTPGGFEARTVVPGRSDGKRTEILRGLAAGTQYAAGASYLLKADLGKGEAEHEH